MIDEYFQRIARCKTLNELNAVHIATCNIMTPTEAIGLHRKMSAPGWRFPVQTVGPDTAAALGIVLVNHMTMMVNDLADAGKDKPERFGRQRVANGVWRFSGGGDRAGKSLVIGFTGNSDRLMMPSPTYLQHFNAADVDIVFLVDRGKRGYRQGIPDVGGSFQDMVDALPGLLAIGEYRKLAVTGTSSGGLPAVLGGLRLKADNIMAIGGNNPEDERWELGETSASQLLVQWAAQSPATKVTLVAGAQSPRDHVSAEATLKLIKADFIKVTDPGQPVKHNAAYPLVTQRKFTAFARQYLGLD
jgi:hypothetical protein